MKPLCKQAAGLALALLVPALALAVKPAKPPSSPSSFVVIAPDQVRSYGSDSEASPIIVLPPAPPPCPPAGTRIGVPRIDFFGEIIAEFTASRGGPNTNPAGDGAIGYLNLGVIQDVLICQDVPLVTTPIQNEEAVEVKDILAVFRFSLCAPDQPGCPLCPVCGRVTEATLEVTPALSGFPGLNPAFWPTIAVSLCDIPVNGIWTNIPELLTLFDSEGDPANADPLDPNPVDPDCIVSNRNFGISDVPLGAFDVMLNAAMDNPEAGHVGGVDNLSSFMGLMRFGATQTIKVPLNQRALDVINAGGNPPGYLELVVRMGDDRGSRSEGPNGTRASLGYPSGANLLVIEDANGCHYGGAGNCNPLGAASTKLVLGAE